MRSAATLKLLEGVLGAPVAAMDVPARPAATVALDAAVAASGRDGQMTDLVSLTGALRAAGLEVQPAGAVERRSST